MISDFLFHCKEYVSFVDQALYSRWAHLWANFHFFVRFEALVTPMPQVLGSHGAHM